MTLARACAGGRRRSGFRLLHSRRALLIAVQALGFEFGAQSYVLGTSVAETLTKTAIQPGSGFVTQTQALPVIAPSDYQAEAEAVLESKNFSLVNIGHRTELTVEAFLSPSYGTVHGKVRFVFADAVNEGKKAANLPRASETRQGNARG